VFDLLCGIEGTIGDFCAVQRDTMLLRPVQVLPPCARVVKANAVNPGRKIRLTAKLMDGLKRGQKHFLCHLRRFVVISEKPIDEVENNFLVPLHQDFKRIGVTLLHAPDAFGVTYAFAQHVFKFY
jgi:hypothetical protein